MKPRYIFASACFLFMLTASLLTAHTTTAVQDRFTSRCPPPYNAPTKHQAIDVACAPEGDVPQTPAREQGREQNRRKNNLCATGTPFQISLTTLERLHQAVVAARRFSFGNDAALNRNRSRTALARVPTVDAVGRRINLGEGQIVSLEAFVLEAKHDDVPLLDPRFGGESVNCHDLTLEGNDIHIALVESAALVERFKRGDRRVECGSVTAEIIPHFRPDVWNRFDSHPRTAPAVRGLPVEGLHVRITGQLFFDASHNPANCAAPRRRSSWEIHPVYAIEVKYGAGFISFVEWASRQH
jgi:hypothetical protein